MKNISKGDGALVALTAFCSQDKWMQQAHNQGLFNLPSLYLKNRHQVVYRKLNTETFKVNERVCFLIKQTCDFINCVDLMLKNPENIKSISTEYGGQRFDKLWSWEQIQTNVAIFNRKITKMDDMFIIPLCIAPFHTNNIVYPSAKYHELKVIIDFIEPYDGPIDLYGNMFFLETQDKEKINSHEFVTLQSQYRGADKIQHGINRVKLDFDHPTTMLYFYGLDKSKIKNIRLILNECNFYDGPLLPLEHVKHSRGLGHVDAVMMFFTTDAFNKYGARANINFSGIKYAFLEIDTDEDIGEIHVVGLSYNGVQYANGRYGLLYV